VSPKRGCMFVVGIVLTLAARLGAQQELPTFEEVVRNLTNANASLLSFRVEQAIDARAWFLRYRVLTTAYAARPARYRVVVHNLPWFMRSLGNVFAHAGRPEDVLAQYVPRVVAWKEEGGRRGLYLDLLGQRSEVNPPRAEVFVDSERWLVERVVLHYDWGEVFAESSYESISGFLLPVTVNVRIPAFYIRAVLTYQDYQLNVPVEDSMFAKK